MYASGAKTRMIASAFELAAVAARVLGAGLRARKARTAGLAALGAGTFGDCLDPFGECEETAERLAPRRRRR